MRLLGVAATMLAMCVLVSGASAAPPPVVPNHFLDTKVAGGMKLPSAMAIAPDGRIFVSEQQGDLRVIKKGVLLPRPFIHLAVNSVAERGLLGVTFDPDFRRNHYVYVFHTATSPKVHNQVTRYTAHGDVAARSSAKTIADLPNLIANNHNGGALHFGHDGKLYVSVGDNARRDEAQVLYSRLGKILRFNPDGTIPKDNPFFHAATGKNRAIWAMGLRNPYTFAFDPGSARMEINDVGAQTWEEVNDGVAAGNYGWPVTEGPTKDARFRGPIFAYRHGETNKTGCAVVGGTFYSPARQQFPASYRGKYFFSDYCQGWIRKLDHAHPSKPVLFAHQLGVLVDLDVGDDGSLYYLARKGEVHRISYLIRPEVESFSPASGKAGTWVHIQGGYLAGTRSVTFNGTAAADVLVASDTSIYARVPAGASTGPLIVTTPAGTAVGDGFFTVTG